jgi:eukaryotic-like serine/threonine-protein kinase
MIEREKIVDELFAQAVDLVPAHREEFFCCARRYYRSLVSEGVIAEVQALLRDFSSAEAEGFLHRPLVSAESGEESVQTLVEGQDFEGYTILKLIDEGGMGEVYLGQDKELDRKVAIKLIKSHLKTTDLLRRFYNERYILANLQHANIARLLEAGATADGWPFFVMEYVDGKPIDKFAVEHDLSIRDRLKLFRTVCSAVSYAHQNLIIHRDLKPRNILVAENGEPKLLDFGVAKLLHEADSEQPHATATLFRVMTPEYASPEQVRGEPVTTSTDVYSLAVLLYELLTGHRPYKLKRRTTDEITKAICEQEPERPSLALSRAHGGNSDRLAASPPDVRKVSDLPEKFPSSVRRGYASEHSVEAQPLPKIKERLGRKGRDWHPSGAAPLGTPPFPHIGAAEPQKLARQLKGDLDNIVLKALRKEPQRRYASVEQFSEDIRRHLEGLPVSARSDTLSYRTSKFVQRNKLGVAAAGIILLILIGGIVTTGWEAHKARVESARAQLRFNEVQELAHSVVFDYHDAIASLPGSTPIRERLVKDAVKYLDNLAVDEGNSPSLQRELAAAYLKVGDVQGRPYSSNLGQSEGALASYRKALAILESLSAANQSDNELSRELATAYERIGNIQLRKGNWADALERNNKALAMRQALLATDPSNKSYRSEVADSYLYVGDALQALCWDVECVRRALESQRRALEIRQALAKEEPSDLQIQRGVAQAYTRVGFRLEYLGVHDDKKHLRPWLESEQASLAIRKELAAADPTNASDRRNLADQLMLTGNAQLGNEGITGALSGYRSALDIFKGLSSADPSNSEARRDFSFIYYRLAAAFEKTGNARAARENYAAIIPIDGRLLAEDPTNEEDLQNLEGTYSRLEDLSRTAGDHAGAIENWRQVVDLRERMLTITPDNSKYVAYLADAYFSMGMLYGEAAGAHANARILDARIPPPTSTKQVQQWREAKSWYQKSLDMYQDMKSKGTLIGTDVKMPDEVAGEIAKCDAVLSKFKAK